MSAIIEYLKLVDRKSKEKLFIERIKHKFRHSFLNEEEFLEAIDLGIGIYIEKKYIEKFNKIPFYNVHEDWDINDFSRHTWRDTVGDDEYEYYLK